MRRVDILFSTVAFGILASVPLRADQLPLNGDMELVGPNGSPVTTTVPGQNHDPSAALYWEQFVQVPGSSLTTELLPSTDPFGGGNMLHVTTNNGYYPPADSGNGIAVCLCPVRSGGAIVSFDIYVVAGSVWGGLVDIIGDSGPFDASVRRFDPTGAWVHVTASTLIDVQGVAFETLTPGAGADYFVDNVRVLTPIPEPRELGFVTVGVLALVIGRKAHVVR